MAGFSVTRFDPDGNALTIVGDPSGHVTIEIENEMMPPRRAHSATIDPDELVSCAYEMLRLANHAGGGSDAIDAALLALKPFADEFDRQAEMATALWAPDEERV